MTLLRSTMLFLLCAAISMPALAQDYGTGVSLDVPYVEPGTITIDGNADEAAWSDAPLLDVTANWDGEWSGHPDPDVIVEARVLYTTDTLFVHVLWEDYTDFFWNPGGGDQILLGVDLVHEAGVTDQVIDDSWSGFSGNTPADGPLTYKLWEGADTIPAISVNWSQEIFPEEEGWITGAQVIDDQSLTWTYEVAIVGEQIQQGGQIGFNLGGGSAKEEGIDDRGGEGTYAFFSWQVCDPEAENTPEAAFCGAGGTVQHTSTSFSTLNLVGDGGPGDGEYGTGVELDVPYVAAAAITLDGNMDEEAWEDAAVLDLTANWDGEWSGHPDPDVIAEARLLYTEGSLYVHVQWEDYTDFFWNPGGGDQILLGVDLVHEAGVTDQVVDDSWSGFAGNTPDDGPLTYKLWEGADTIPAISVNWSEEIFPEQEGWVTGGQVIDDQALTWSFELAIHGDQIQQGSQIGFNIGGGSAKEEGIDDRGGEGTYAFFSWQVCDPEAPNVPEGAFCGSGGTVQHTSTSFSTLNLVASTAIDPIGGEIPSAFHLDQNYPNPFNPSTQIEFGLERAAHVGISVFNALGQRIATLVDGVQQPGAYSVGFEARDLPSGIYLYRLEIDGRTVSTRKMVLMR